MINKILCLIFLFLVLSGCTFLFGGEDEDYIFWQKRYAEIDKIIDDKINYLEENKFDYVHFTYAGGYGWSLAYKLTYIFYRDTSKNDSNTISIFRIYTHDDPLIERDTSMIGFFDQIESLMNCKEPVRDRKDSIAYWNSHGSSYNVNINIREQKKHYYVYLGTSEKKECDMKMAHYIKSVLPKEDLKNF